MTSFDRPMYSLSEAARLLKVPASTLRWWLEGLERDGHVYPPVIRERSTGSSDLSWQEFVEAGLLREYRKHVSVHRLRALVDALRVELKVLHPLATVQPLVSGRELVWNLQRKLDIPEELWLVVGGDQLVLGNEASSFFERVEFDPVTEEVNRYILLHADEPVTVDPAVAFGVPSIRGVRAESLSELANAGEPAEVIVDIYSHYGITDTDVDLALEFERIFMLAAA